MEADGMKHARRELKIIMAAAGVFLAAAFVINIAGYIFDCRYLSVFATAGAADKYEVRSRLLSEAMDDVGVCSAGDAALVWAKGLYIRSGALQYSVMSKELKREYEKRLEKNAPNWVTGVSSPWIEDYSIESIRDLDGRSIVTIVFSTLSSTGPAGELRAKLCIAREGAFWRIEYIDAEKGLSPYMGTGG